MSYRQIKWFIILAPMLTIEIWEFLRHECFYPYISMRMGNLLSALIVLAVTLLVTMRLFARMEYMQEELNRERADKARLMERERIARELHDGIAQSLFLLSVKAHKLQEGGSQANGSQIQALKETIRRVHDDVRQAIANLRLPPTLATSSWSQTVKEMIEDFEKETGVAVSLQWDLEEAALTSKEKVEVFACLREALMNIRKHAGARHAWIQFGGQQADWSLSIEDDGRGFEGDPFIHPGRYGLRMMRERTEEMGWSLQVERTDERTKIIVRKGEPV